MNHSTPGLPVHHQLLEFTQTHVHRVGDAIQPSHPLSSPSPPALNLSQHQGVFQWVNSSHEVARVLEFQLQHQSFSILSKHLSCTAAVTFAIWSATAKLVQTSLSSFTISRIEDSFSPAALSNFSIWLFSFLIKFLTFTFSFKGSTLWLLWQSEWPA